MNQPGLSLFQGAGSLHLNQSAARLEEEEELLDQQRRREEVQNRLDNEFGDLSDDNDETNASEYTNPLPPPSYPNGHHQQHPPKSNVLQPTHPHHNNAENHQPHPPPAYGDERADLLAKFKAEQDLEELKRRLAICESEKQRAYMARQQSHELLVESKSKCSDQEEQIVKLRSSVRSLEQTNTELQTQLECKQTMLNDALLKYQMVERNAGLTADRHVELALKQANERTAAQATMHQQQLDSMRSQLDATAHELKTLQARHAELQRSREALLVEKSETINKLSASIEDAQRHNQQLIAASRSEAGAGFEEAQRLRNTVAEQSDQIDRLEHSLQSAQAELHTVTSLLHETTSAAAAAAPQTPKMLHLQHSSSTPIAATASTDSSLTARLRSELQRSLADQKERRAELQLLQRQLADRDADLERLRTTEARQLVELEQLRSDSRRQATQLRHLQGDLQRVFRLHGMPEEEVRSDTADKVIDALQAAHERRMGEHAAERAELMKLQAEHRVQAQRMRELEVGQVGVEEAKQAMRRLQVDGESLRVKYAEVVALNERLSAELEELRTGDVRAEYQVQRAKLEAAEKNLASSEADYKRLEGEVAGTKAALDQKIRLLTDQLNGATTTNSAELQQLRSDCSAYRQECAQLSAQLQQSAATIADLRHSVALRQDNNQLLADLQTKAERFDQYIQQQQQQQQKQLQQHTPSPPPLAPSTPLHHGQPPRSPERCASALNHQSTTPESRRSADESRMAAVLAKKLKAIEDGAKREELRLQQHIDECAAQLRQTADQLAVRDSEVQLLKQAILAERSKMREMMEERDAEVGEVFEKQQTMLDKYRERLDVVQTAVQRLNERIAGLMAERKELLAARDRLVLDAERLRAERDRREGEREEERDEWRRKCEKVEAQRRSEVEEWEGKYRAAKKTAASYKRYSEAKDAHIERENERVKAEYKKAIAKIQEKAENIMKTKLSL